MGEGGRGKWLEPNHRGWLGDTTLCRLRMEALLRGAPAPRMRGGGHLQFQRELLTSKRPSLVALFMLLSLIGCKNLRAILARYSVYICSYSPTALGRVGLDHECEAQAGNFSPRGQTNMRKLRLSLPNLRKIFNIVKFRRA